MKYTLYCVPGFNFTPSVHCLYLGEWLPYRDNMIILEHGNLPQQDANRIIRSGRVSCYLDHRYHTISIQCGYNAEYLNRVSKQDELRRYVGCLTKAGDNIFFGGLDI